MIPKIILDRYKSARSGKINLPPYIEYRLGKESKWGGSEHHLQRSFFAWIAKITQSPEISLPVSISLWLSHAIPNGGKRGAAEAARFAAEGVKAGIPDVFIPIPTQDYAGFYIEFKKPKGVIKDDQIVILNLLHDQGYKCAVVDDLEVVKVLFVNYLKLPTHLLDA
jgi:hypothetical protein